MLIGDFNVDFLNPKDTNYSHLQSTHSGETLFNFLQIVSRKAIFREDCFSLCEKQFVKS